MTMNVEVVSSPAKLTISLRMTGVLPNGYHLIDAEMVSLSLADELTFSDGDGLSVTLHGAAAGGLPVTGGSDNLIAKALRHVGRQAQVDVRKVIPAGAGLGGGSGNAAAVLRWAGFTSAQQVSDSAVLGADVPFCVLGGRAQVTGIGEVLTDLEFIERSFTLICPPFGVSTPAVYQQWDAMGGPEGDNGNDLEPAAVAVEPRLAVWRDRLWEATGVRPRLAGSGSTWFVEGAFPKEHPNDSSNNVHIVTTTTPKHASRSGD
jgi:4-diphosphocytidyl-2-C-methyl-D-erythritol kinase